MHGEFELKLPLKVVQAKQVGCGPPDHKKGTELVLPLHVFATEVMRIAQTITLHEMNYARGFLAPHLHPPASVIIVGWDGYISSSSISCLHLQSMKHFIIIQAPEPFEQVEEECMLMWGFEYTATELSDPGPSPSLLQPFHSSKFPWECLLRQCSSLQRSPPPALIIYRCNVM
eukprot:1149766-Pelagomonas_calceolata.AAC.7